MWSHLPLKVRTKNPAFRSSPFLQKSLQPDVLVVEHPTPSKSTGAESGHVFHMEFKSYLFLKIAFILFWLGSSTV